ncbi:hypothetical protein IV203_007202 [Nitzschia inconspicua]|uniref:RING-type domain-containing protein n=1 Tax=Nitzschia inconspicua TaxID=303405 RepID=A0A9K3KED5_9STRA|nr:hypothetical protein IV203_007202 [Nitzschia inconspicua]
MNGSNAQEEGAEEVCPICLVGDNCDVELVVDDEELRGEEQQSNQHDKSMVFGKCGHKFCLPCLKQLFAAPSRSPRDLAMDRDDGVIRFPTQEDLLDIPTMGRCPICRRTLCLLDLKKQNSSSSNTPTKYAVPRETELCQTELSGMVFVKRKRNVGEESIHFPKAEVEGAEDCSPFLSFEKRIYNWVFDDESRMEEKRKFFDPKSLYFHKESRTFHGTIRWDLPPSSDRITSSIDCGKRLNGSNAWEYFLSFSSDFRYVTRGVLIIRRDPCRRKDCRRVECKFPLDGEWIVEWDPDNNSLCQRMELNMVLVHGNMVFPCDGSHKPLGKIEYGLMSGSPMLSWIDEEGEYENQTQFCTLQPENCLAKKPEGPPVGTSVVWPGISDTMGKMVWRRKTVTPDEAPLQVVKIGYNNGILYHRLGAVADTSIERPTYFADKLWGNVFCQALTVGLASYHFNEDGTAYISYDHERTSVWPNLDNGEPIPPTISFLNTCFDEESRTFRGTIDWEGTHGSTWTSSRRWRYEIIFAKDYSMIIGGDVRVVRRGEDSERIMSRFGDDLLYINVGLAEKMKDYFESAAAGSLPRIAPSFRGIRRQVEDIGGSIESAERLYHLFTLVPSSDIHYPATRLSSTQDYGM